MTTTTRTTFGVLTTVMVMTACHGGHGMGHSGDQLATPATAEPVLTEVAIAVPIAPGKTEAWRAALDELLGPRYAEYETSRRRYGLTSQTTFLQQTPMGDFALIHLTGADVHASFHAMSSSRDPWDVRWRELTLNLHGMDFSQGERVVPKIVPVYSMDGGDASGAKPFMFIAPLGGGGAVRFRDAAREVMAARHADYVQARTELGIRREAVFLESTPNGDAAVFYWLADDPIASLKQLVTSMAPFDVWLRAEANSVHSIGLDAIASIASHNTMVARYPH